MFQSEFHRGAKLIDGQREGGIGRGGVSREIEARERGEKGCVKKN